MRSEPRQPARELPSAPRAGLYAGAALCAGLWLSPTPLIFAALWAALILWMAWRSRGSSGGRLPVFALAGAGLAALPLLWPAAPPAVLAICLAIAAGAVPAHVLHEDLRRSLARGDMAMLTVTQPGVALLHAFLHAQPDALPEPIASALQSLFVVTALVHSGLGLVRREPERALTGVAQSQAALVLAGTLAGEHGWAAARMMLFSLALSSFVLLAATEELRRRHGVVRLSHRNALAVAAPDVHRVFVTCGWLFVGLPGGAAFFAEDLLFHALVEHAPLATFGFVLATGLNAVVFYRTYLGLFAGSSRPGRALFAAEPPPDHPPARGLLPTLLGLTALSIVVGFFPGLLL